MTPLRQRMLHELQRRNYSPSTNRGYLGAVSQFAEYFHRSPEQLGPEHLRRYQRYLLQEKRLAPSTVEMRIGECVPFHNQKRFTIFLRTLYRQDWVVYAKPPFGGPDHVLHYLARYTHRVAISNHRLLSVSAAEVCFRWKDYAHHGRQRALTLAPEEFLRRFVQHVLPRGFPRIRYFGFLANRRRARMLPLCRALLHQALPQETPFLQKPSLWTCPHCHGLMHLVERMTASQLFFAGHVEEKYRLDSS